MIISCSKKCLRGYFQVQDVIHDQSREALQYINSKIRKKIRATPQNGGAHQDGYFEFHQI